MENRSQSIDSAQPVAPGVYYIQTLIANVCFIGETHCQPAEWVLVDAGLANAAAQIRQTASDLYGNDSKPKAIILTHGHFDHVGAVEELVNQWQVPVYAHEAELPYLTGKLSYPPPDPTTSDGLMAKISPLYPRDPINLGSKVNPLPSDGKVPFLPGWYWVFTPGHTPGHISLFRESDRVLVAGDTFTTVKQESALAVMTQAKAVHGPPAYFTVNWQVAKESIGKLRALKPLIVITGHGRPMRDEELKEQLTELIRDFDREVLPKQGHYVDHPVPVDSPDRDTYLNSNS